MKGRKFLLIFTKDSLFIAMYVTIMVVLNSLLTIPTLIEIWINTDCLIIWKILLEIFIALFLFIISFGIAGILTMGTFGED